MSAEKIPWETSIPIRRVFVASRKRIAGIVTLGLAFDAGMSLGAVWGGGPELWALAAFFSLCTLVGFVQLVKPNRLVLTPTGFEAITWGRTVRYGWIQCGPFSVWGETPNKLIIYATDRTNRPVARFITRMLSGADGNISAYYRGISPAELATLMNDYQTWALQHPLYRPDVSSM